LTGADIMNGVMKTVVRAGFLWLAFCVPAAVMASPKPRYVTPVYVSWKGSPQLIRGCELWASGKRAAALVKFKQAVYVSPQDPIAWHNLGVAFFVFGRYEESLRSHIQERFFSPTAPSAWYGIGRAQYMLGRYPEAENAFVMGVVEAPRQWEYWRELGMALRAQGKIDSALVAEANAARMMPRILLSPWTPVGIQKAITTLRFPPVTTFR